MRETANASIDFTGVPHLLARPSKGDPNGVVVYSEIQPILDSLSTKLDLAHLKIEQQKNNAAIIKRFALTGGVAEVKASPEDGENYTYTTFTIPTGFVDNAGNPTVDFEDFAMSAVLQPFANEGFRYEFHKEAPDHAVVVFQNIAGAFPDDRVRISLILIPETVQDSTQTLPLNSQINPTDPALQTFKQDFMNWSDWDNRWGAGTWDSQYLSTGFNASGVPTIYFKNGRNITKPEADTFYAAGDLHSVDERGTNQT